MSWYDSAVLYQIYPLGLLGAPWKNDGTKEGFQEVGSHAHDGHRLLNLIDDGWVEHIKKLGATCVMFNPLCSSDSHGYDTRDYLCVDERLGTHQDLIRVIDALHAKGIKVVFDGVFNHVGRGFWAFQDVLAKKQESPYASWFSINWSQDNSYGDGFSYDTWEAVPFLVKLNHANFELNAYIADVIKSWEADFKIDGVRLDVAYCLDKGFLSYLRQIADELTQKRQEKFILIGETLFGDYRQWMNDTACDSVYNYEAYKGLWSSFNENNMHEIAYSLKRQFGNDPWDLYTGEQLLSFVDNHDVTRIATQLKNKAQLPALYGLLFGMPGVPCIYYGSEWGAQAEKKPGDHELRPAFEKPQSNELSTYISQLIYARTKSKGAPALTCGDYKELLCKPTQLVFSRATTDCRVIVALNIADHSERLHFDAGCGQAIDLLTGKLHDFGGGSEVEPYSCHLWLCER